MIVKAIEAAQHKFNEQTKDMEYKLNDYDRLFQNLKMTNAFLRWAAVARLKKLE